MFLIFALFGFISATTVNEILHRNEGYIKRFKSYVDDSRKALDEFYNKDPIIQEKFESTVALIDRYLPEGGQSRQIDDAYNAATAEVISCVGGCKCSKVL